MVDYLAKNKVDYILVAPDSSIWQDRYIPMDSKSTSQVLPLITSFLAESNLTLIYDSGSELIRVFKTNVGQASQ